MNKKSAALVQSPISLSSILENAEDAIITIDSKQQILMFNKGAEKIFGYSSEEVIGRKLGILMPYTYRTAHTKYVHNFGKSREISRPMFDRSEISGKRKDGSIFPAEANISQLEIEGERFFTAILRDITARKNIENKLRESLNEKEILIQEVNHRVKNNLQMIISLFSLQGESIDDPERIANLKDIQQRVQSMALIHEKIYNSESIGKINFQKYVKDLIKEIFHSYQTSSSNVKHTLEIEPLSLEINMAIPLALILNELILNALKYAFNGREKGNFILRLKKKSAKQIHLTISDDGIGIPENIKIYSTKTLGLRLVRVLTQQLNGRVKLRQNPDCLESRGTMFVFDIPIE
jgi:PAS domain S-box-containing protein